MARSKLRVFRVVGFVVAALTMIWGTRALAEPLASAQEVTVLSSTNSLVPSLTVQAYQESLGWRSAVSDGVSSGGDGSNLALQGLRVSVSGSARDLAGNIAFELLDTAGNWSVVAGGTKEPWAAGSRDAAGLKAWLTGDVADQFDLCYQVSVSHVGWLDWVKNGAETGVSDVGLPVDALRFALIPKGDRLPQGGGIGQTWVRRATLSFWAYRSDIGEVGPAASGTSLGVPGRALHDFKAQLTGSERIPGALSYRVNTGDWRSWTTGGSACPVESNAPIYALQLSLSGAAERVYDVWYRLYIHGVGWLGYARNGETAGSLISGRCADRVEVHLVPKGSSAPGATARPVITNDSMGLCLASVAGASDGLSALGGGYDFSSAAARQLRQATDALTSRGAQLSYVMVDLYTGRGVAYNANSAIYSASALKGPYVAAVNKFNAGAVSGWVRDTMYQTIQNSSNEGYASLRNSFGTAPMAQMQAFVGGCGFSPARNYTNISGRDLAKLWVGAYDYFFVHQNENSAWCRGLYTNPLLSFIHRAMGPYAATYTKAGWISSGPGLTARNDAGIVMAANGPYVVAILSTAYGQDTLLCNLVHALNAVHTDLGCWD